jgi:hypothetical protein
MRMFHREIMRCQHEGKARPRDFASLLDVALHLKERAKGHRAIARPLLHYAAELVLLAPKLDP